MEPRPGGLVAVVAAAVLLLLGAQCQDHPPGPGCNCAHLHRKRDNPLCCGGCPAGHFKNGSCSCGPPNCTPCQPGSFLAQENHHTSSCARCHTCDETFFQVTLESCSAVADVRCGCKPGWFADCWDQGCVDKLNFKCHPCVDCEALRRHPQESCSRTEAECGPCLPGFYEHANNSCVSCPTMALRSCPEPCVPICGWRQMFWVQVLLAGLVVLLLLGAILTYAYCRRQPSKPRVPAEEAGMAVRTPLQVTHLSPQESIHALLVPPSEKVLTAHLAGNGWAGCSLQEVPWDQPSRVLGPAPLPTPSPAPPAGSPAAMLQPGPQLYDVVDAVPARRWKEFVRTLGLREAEIEAVEVEVGRFRDQQYEMLKRWRQQQPAGLGAVYAALERMGLGGCAEDLRGRLQQRGP